MKIKPLTNHVISLSNSKRLSKHFLAITILSAIISLSSCTVNAMSIFDAGKAYVFSPVRLHITIDEKPAKGLKVIRRWSWNEDKDQDSAITDDNGVVEFPEVRRRGITQFFPAEFVAAQQIVVIVDGNENRIWSFSKRNPKKNSELEGIPLDLTCELNSEEKMYRDFGPVLFTKCTWRDQ